MSLLMLEVAQLSSNVYGVARIPSVRYITGQSSSNYRWACLSCLILIVLRRGLSSPTSHWIGPNFLTRATGPKHAVHAARRRWNGETCLVSVVRIARQRGRSHQQRLSAYRPQTTAPVLQAHAWDCMTRFEIVDIKP